MHQQRRAGTRHEDNSDLVLGLHGVAADLVDDEEAQGLTGGGLDRAGKEAEDHERQDALVAPRQARRPPDGRGPQAAAGGAAAHGRFAGRGAMGTARRRDRIGTSTDDAGKMRRVVIGQVAPDCQQHDQRDGGKGEQRPRQADGADDEERRHRRADDGAQTKRR